MFCSSYNVKLIVCVTQWKASACNVALDKIMVLLLVGKSEYGAPVWNAINRSNHWDWSLRAHPFLRYHLIQVPLTKQSLLAYSLFASQDDQPELKLVLPHCAVHCCWNVSVLCTSNVFDCIPLIFYCS